MRSRFGFPLAILACAMTMGCEKKKDDEKKQTGQVTLNLALAPPDDGLSLNRFATTFHDLGIADSATGEGLRSLKMYFREIKICKDLEMTGSGYNNPTGCVALYTNMEDDYTGTEAPTAADREHFTAAGEGKFYDILSASDIAKLKQPVAVDVGEYNYGIIETHPWVKINAKSGNLCTLPAGANEAGATGGDGIVSYRTEVTSLDCGTGDAEETLVYITNANTNFKFLKPFTVAEGDDVTVDLAFNMDKEVKSFDDHGRIVLGTSGSTAGFYIPMIRMSPAPRKSGETTKTETYILGAATDKEQVRMQIYYNSADADKAILGINGTVFGTDFSTESTGNKPMYTYHVEQEGDVVTFKSWDDSVLMSFTRGAAGTATINCEGSGGGSALEACDGHTEIEMAYGAPTIGDL